MSEQHNQRAAVILQKILYITISTVTPTGEPWNSPVYAAFDQDLTFYWCSDEAAQHSQNIQANQQVFLVIYDSTVPEGTGEGVYIRAVAEQLQEGVAIVSALRILDNRVGKTKPQSVRDFSGAAPLRVYRAKPLQVWVNDDELDKQGAYIKDIRVEIPLEDLRKQLS